MSQFKPMLASPVDFDKLDYADLVVSPKYDGCFTATTRVWTDVGLVPIGHIVKNKLAVNVASYNELTHEVEFKPITGWFDNGLKSASEWMGFSKKAKITRGHKVFSRGGWVAAESGAETSLHVDTNLGAAITGMILGDSVVSIEKRHKNTQAHVQWRLLHSTCEADSAYGKAKVDLLSGWLTFNERRFISGYRHPQVGYTSTTCRALPYDISRFYVTDVGSEDYGKRKKDLTLCDVQDDFNDLSLALWYFDDGCIQNNNGNPATPRIHWSVARYSDATLEVFKDLFRVKYGCTPTIEKYGKDIKMSFSSPESVYLLWRIARAAGSLMPRKIPDGFPMGATWIAAEPVWEETLVKNPVSSGSEKLWRAYDIEVQDNHNYFAEGMLVHNCRAVVIDGVVMSRSLKPIPNKHVQKLFSHLEHYDGELIAGSPTSPSCYRDTASAVMSVDGEPEVTFYVFDHVQHPDKDFILRLDMLQIAPSTPNVVKVPQIPVSSESELREIQARHLEEGYEGLMLRKARGLNSKYKFGRATAKSNTLLKLKEFSDSEARVVGYAELMKNGNEATINELGHAERSSHKENMIPMGVLGALHCVTEDGVEFSIGSGFDAETRRTLWVERETLVGRLVKFKHFEVGSKTAPRFPTFLGFRSPEDI